MPPTEDQKEQLVRTASDILEPWAAEHAGLPEVLYHYTSADGLIGILQSRSIWLTDLRYVNDLSELQYARELVRTRIDSRRTSAGLAAVETEFLRRVRDTFDPFQYGSSVFAASFCEVGNLLSQWRAYRGRGGGYAIGVDFFHTLRLMSRPCVLRRVIYDPVRQSQILDSAIDRFLTALRTMNEGKNAQETEEFLPAACQTFAGVMGEFLFAFKHPDFVEEREWRLVHFARVDPRMNRGAATPFVRSYEGNVIPYFPVEMTAAIDASKDDTFGIPFPFVELVIGPTLSGDLNRESISTLLLGLNPDVEPRIRQSAIPLRWL